MSQNVITSFFKLIRVKNLLILAITQSIVYYKLIYSSSSGFKGELELFLFGLLILSTILITASGYIINDIIDVDIDQLNKPDKMIINRVFSIRLGWYLYWSITGIGFLISLYIAFQIDNLPLVLIYPFAILVLFFYSKYFKKQGLVGNLVVSLFSAFVIGIVWFAEREFVAKVSNSENQIIEIFTAFMVFSFLVSMYREIIKDIEDVKGDSHADYSTLPITAGVEKAKYTAMFFGGILAIMSAKWMIFQLISTVKSLNELWIESLYISIFLIFGILYIIFKTNKAQGTHDYSQISQYLKTLMMAGIIYLFIVS